MILWLNAIMMERKAQDQDKFIVRLPSGLRNRIKIAADANNRSMNAEVVATLEAQYPAPPANYEDFADDLVAIVQARTVKERDQLIAEFNKKRRSEEFPVVASMEDGKISIEIAMP